MSGPFRFCPSCASEGGRWVDGRQFVCPGCGFRFFQNVAAACGVLVRSGDRYLFVERARDPSRGLLGLPGGFVDPGESVEQALSREVAEEVGASLGPVTFLGSFPNRYPYAGVEYHTCDLYFAADLHGDEGALRLDAGEVSGVKWLAADEVSLDRLAFPSLRALWKSLRLAEVSR